MKTINWISGSIILLLLSTTVYGWKEAWNLFSLQSEGGPQTYTYSPYGDQFTANGNFNYWIDGMMSKSTIQGKGTYEMELYFEPSFRRPYEHVSLNRFKIYLDDYKEEFIEQSQMYVGFLEKNPEETSIQIHLNYVKLYGFHKPNDIGKTGDVIQGPLVINIDCQQNCSNIGTKVVTNVWMFMPEGDLLDLTALNEARNMKNQSLNSRLTKIEGLMDYVGEWLNTTRTQLGIIQNWLFFGKYSSSGKTVCDTISNECKAPIIKCSSNGDCGTDFYLGNPSCSGNDVYQYYLTYKCTDAGFSTAHCSNTTSSQLKTTCTKKCLSGSCVDCLSSADCAAGQNCVNNVCQGGIPPTGRCTFRTSAANGNYATGTWIAVDVDNDGDLEGFDYSGSSGNLAACGGSNIAKTPQGYTVAIANGKPQICFPITGGKVVQKKYFTASTKAVLSTSPTAPYTGNLQEVCST